MNVVYFDICAAILITVIIFSVVSRRMTNSLINKLYLVVLSVNLFTAMFDIWAVVMNRSADPSVYSLAARYIAHTGYLYLHNITSLVYLLYVIGLTDTWHKTVLRSPALKCTVTAAYLALAVLFAVNPLNGWMFYFNDENHMYTRGPFFTLLYVYAFTFMVSGVLYLIKYKKLFPKEKFIALLFMTLAGALAVIIQWFNVNLLVEMFCGAISLLYITIMVQRPEEIVDSVTGLLKYEAYAVDMKKNFANDKHVTSIIINISNYTALSRILSYDEANGLLKNVADILSDINRELKARADIYYLDRGRFRFVVDTSRDEVITAAAEKINFSLKQGISFNKMSFNLITYVCIARCPEDIVDFQTLMRFGADVHERFPYTGQVMRASDIAKKYAFELNNSLDDIISDAIEGRKFKVYYQPIYSTEEERFVSAEALLRLIDDKHGFISPELLVTAAERSGAIHRIGDFVMDEVCRFISGGEFERLGLEYIEVNLSVAQCMAPDLADRIIGTMQNYCVSPDKINLEITETAANYAQNIMMANINKLIEHGVSFSLDDYGTGYSNINRVASLPLKIVKLDKSFVDLEDNPRMWIILCSTIEMLKGMDMSIVVEGIETHRLLKKFADLECEYIQGYYFSKPVPEDQFVKFIQKSLQKTMKM